MSWIQGRPTHLIYVGHLLRNLCLMLTTQNTTNQEHVWFWMKRPLSQTLFVHNTLLAGGKKTPLTQLLSHDCRCVTGVQNVTMTDGTKPDWWQCLACTYHNDKRPSTPKEIMLGYFIIVPSAGNHTSSKPKKRVVDPPCYLPKTPKMYLPQQTTGLLICRTSKVQDRPN